MKDLVVLQIRVYSSRAIYISLHLMYENFLFMTLYFSVLIIYLILNFIYKILLQLQMLIIYDISFVLQIQNGTQSSFHMLKINV